MIIKNVIKFVFTVFICACFSVFNCCQANRKRCRKNFASTVNGVGKSENRKVAVERDIGCEGDAEPVSAESVDPDMNPGLPHKRPHFEDVECENVDDSTELERDDDTNTEVGDDRLAVFDDEFDSGDGSDDDSETDFESDCEDEFASACREVYGCWVAGSAHDCDLRRKTVAVNRILNMHTGCERLYGKYAVVGDIHGDIGIFKALTEILQNDIDVGKIDGVVFLGDFWDRLDGDVQVFEMLIDFIYRNNSVSSYKIIVLRGNHELYSYRFSQDGVDTHYSQYVTGLPVDLRFMIDSFYSALPFNVIINDNTYLVHGGLPVAPGLDVLDVARRLISRDILVYPREEVGIGPSVFDVVYSSVWSDFDENISDSELYQSNRRRNFLSFEACRFGTGLLRRYSECFNSCDPKLKINNYIFGHDHAKGPFSQSLIFDRGSTGDKGYVTTVITAPFLTVMLDRIQRGGAVALVNPARECPIKYFDIVPNPRGRGVVIKNCV